MPSNNMASSGHRLGQVIGDWYEEYFALPLLTKIAKGLELFVDSRFKKRSCRRDKFYGQILMEIRLIMIS